MIPYGVKNSVFILGLNCFQNGSMTTGQFSVVDSLVGAPPDRQLLNLGVFNQLIEVRKPSSPHQVKMELQVGFVGTDRIHSCAVIKVIAELNQLGVVLRTCPTDKQTPRLPLQCAADIEGFFTGIGLHTPEDVHYRTAVATRRNRAHVLEAAQALFPERFPNGKPVPPFLPEAVWINPPEKENS